MAHTAAAFYNDVPKRACVCIHVCVCFSVRNTVWCVHIMKCVGLMVICET